jgi:hypothetical protein
MSPEMKSGLLAFGITIGGALAIDGVALAIAAPATAGLLVVGLLSMLFVLALVVGLIALIILTSIGTVCPECGKRWARVFVKRRIIEQKKCYGLVTRHAHSSSSGWISGTSSHTGSIHHTSHGGTVHSSGTTSWNERVPVIRTTYLMHYQCKYCQASWTEEKVEQVEDFDIER